MMYRKILPPKPLAALIDSLSYWEGGAPSQDLMSVMASPTPSIQINLHDDQLRWYEDNAGRNCHRLKGVTITGPQKQPFAIDAWQSKIMRVTFKPGGVRSIFRIAPTELRNTQLSLEDIWGPSAARLQQQLAEAKTSDDALRLLSEILIAAADGDAQCHPAVSLALATCAHAQAPVAVASLAKQAQLSSKRFIRLFTEQVGLTPKLFFRLRRFERLLADLYESEHHDWAQIASDYGYFDQSHLIRDFQEFAGMTPTAYVAHRGPAEHHTVA